VLKPFKQSVDFQEKHPVATLQKHQMRLPCRYKFGGLTHGFVFDICTVILADYHRFSCFAIRLKAVHNSIFSFHPLSWCF